MSTGQFEDLDHDRPEGIVEAMRETAFSFDSPTSTVLHAGALAHARRHRRRSAAGVLAAIAVVGVAGAVATGIPSQSGNSESAAAGTTPGSSAPSASASTASASPVHSSSPALAPPAKHATTLDHQALAKFVLNTALAGLPAGVHPVSTSFGVMGSKLPPYPDKHLPVVPPTDILGGVNGTWSTETASGSVGIAVRTNVASCEAVKKIYPQDVCTTTPFDKGGQIIFDQSRKDPVTQTGSYMWDYTWVRPDGALITISQAGNSVSNFAWTPQQMSALLELPAWDQAVAQLKTYIADAGSTSSTTAEG